MNCSLQLLSVVNMLPPEPGSLMSSASVQRLWPAWCPQDSALVLPARWSHPRPAFVLKRIGLEERQALGSLVSGYVFTLPQCLADL